MSDKEKDLLCDEFTLATVVCSETECRVHYWVSIPRKTYREHQEVVSKAISAMGWLWIREQWLCPRCERKLGGYAVQKAREAREMLVKPYIGQRMTRGA